MDWYTDIVELIDLRSFSNLWFWIALAVVWSSASHWVLGVPYDMVMRARRMGGQAEADLEHIVRINVNRLLFIGRVSGLWLAGIFSFVLTALGILGWHYDVEFAQATFLLAFPLTLVGCLSPATARRTEVEQPVGEGLCRRLAQPRLYTQLIGTLSIFVTAIWGMYVNLSLGVLGG